MTRPPARALELDTLLRVIVALANMGAVRAHVTLMVGGILVSGNLIGADDYLREMGAIAGKETLLGGFFDSYPARDPTPKEGKLKDDMGQAFDEALHVHLSSARFFLPGDPAIPEEGVLWRGKLAAIDAFFLGALETV